MRFGKRLAKHFKRLNASILCISLCLCPLCLFSQVKTTNGVLQNIIEQIPDFRPSENSYEEIFLKSISPSVPIIVNRNNQKEICHIGIRLFNQDIQSKHPSPLYRFIERYLLELLLLPNNEQVALKLRMERVKMTSEVTTFGNYRKGIINMLSVFSQDCSILITCNNNRYTFSCIDKGKILLKLSFPVRHELITGLSKIEAENSIYPSLLVHRAGEKTSPLVSDLTAYHDSIYIYNDDYYITENIISTSFYKHEGDKYNLIFTPLAMTESIYNLFNSNHDWEVNANITQSMYGNKKLSFTLPLVHILDFLRSQGCNLYTGIKNMKGNLVEGTLLAVNMELGYQHLLIFKVEKAVFNHPSGTEVRIKMYSYIPIHNISSILENNKNK